MKQILKLLDVDDANAWNIDVGDRFFDFEKTVWFVAKGDEASGIKKIPVKYKGKVFCFCQLLSCRYQL